MSRSPDDLHPRVREQWTELEKAAEACGFPVKLTQTFRTFAEQQAIWDQGRTTPGPIVTHAKAGYSWHNWRLAFDVIFKTPEGSVTYDGPWDDLGAVGESLGLEWGGRWKHPDRPHFENRMGKTLAGLLADHPKGLTGAA